MSSKPSCDQSEDGPKWCWHCNKLLHHVPGRPGYHFFARVVSPGGHVQRVHGACVSKALADGSKPHAIDAEFNDAYRQNVNGGSHVG